MLQKMPTGEIAFDFVITSSRGELPVPKVTRPATMMDKSAASFTPVIAVFSFTVAFVEPQ